LVLVEAMMCGTPVAAMNLGAVPEIIEQGITGYRAASVEDFSNALEQACKLDRRLVRERAAARFSQERMAREYLEVYEKLI
jgi:glycosyltransferase involved in cell wall biosynthesis